MKLRPSYKKLGIWVTKEILLILFWVIVENEGGIQSAYLFQNRSIPIHQNRFFSPAFNHLDDFSGCTLA